MKPRRLFSIALLSALSFSGADVTRAARNLPEVHRVRSEPPPASGIFEEDRPAWHCGLSAFQGIQRELGKAFPARPLSLERLREIGRLDNLGRVAVPEPGSQDNFWTWDFELQSYNQITATLKVIGDYCYIYLDDEAVVSDSILEDLKRAFDEQIYLQVRSCFGEEWSPGIDQDPRITILFIDIRDSHYHEGSGNYIAGYFSPSDEYDEDQVAPLGYHSNQREMIYLDTDPATPGSSDQLATLAHEFQHMIHWYQDVEEELWVNEGCSELASFIAGYGLRRLNEFRREPENNLIDWGDSLADYEQVMLWTLYFWEHFGGNATIKDLVASTDVGIDGYNQALINRGSPVRFPGLFHDWSIATILDDREVASGRYAYENYDLQANPISATRTHQVAPTSPIADDIDPWSSHYIVVEQGGNQRLGYAGPDQASVIEMRPPLPVIRDFKGEIQLSEFGGDGSYLILVLFGGEAGGDYSYSFDAPVGPDTDPPLLVGGPWIDSITPTSCALSWITNEAGDTQIRYGVDQTYELGYYDADPVISHGAVLTQLSPGTVYHFQAGSTDTLGNGPRFSPDGVFITPALVSHLADTLRYDNGTAAFFMSDSVDPVDLRCVRFTPALAGTLKAGMFYFYDRTGAASGEVVVLEDAGGVPGKTLGTVAVPPDSIRAFHRGGDWTRVALDDLGVVLAPGVDFYLGYRTVSPGPGDSLNVLTDSGSPPMGRSWEMYDGRWYRIADVYPAPYNLMIRAVIHLEDSPLVDLEPPLIVRGPDVFLVDSGRVLIAWTTDEPATSIIEYGLTPQLGLEVVHSAVNRDHAVVLEDIVADTTYYYRVGSVDRHGRGPTLSEISSFSTHVEFASPIDFSAYDGFNRAVPLDWSSPVVDRAASGRSAPGLKLGARPVLSLEPPVGYNLYRSRESGGPYKLVAARWPLTSYTDSTLSNGTTYYYGVTAVYNRPYGESRLTPEASAVPGLSRMVTIAYDRSSNYAWSLPNQRGDSAYAVKFTSGLSGRLYRADLMFADRPDSGSTMITVWTDDGGRPGEVIGTKELPAGEIFAVPVWTGVSLLSLGIDVDRGESFFIGLSAGDSAADTLHLVSDNGETAGGGGSEPKPGSIGRGRLGIDGVGFRIEL